MRILMSIGALVATAVAAGAQSMPADYDAVLKVLGRTGDLRAMSLR
jgi:hypothetical protein